MLQYLERELEGFSFTYHGAFPTFILKGIVQMTTWLTLALNTKYDHKLTLLTDIQWLIPTSIEKAIVQLTVALLWLQTNGDGSGD